MRRSQETEQFLPHAVHPGVGQAEIHFLVAPGAAGNAVLFKRLVDHAVPAHRILRRGLVDDAVFAAVQFRAVAPGRLDGRGEQMVKIIGRQRRFREGYALLSSLGQIR